MKKYYWSFDKYEEIWDNQADTVEECLVDAMGEIENYAGYQGIDDDKIKSVFIGELHRYNSYICGHKLIDILMEQAYEDVGESTGGWLKTITDREVEKLQHGLNEVFGDWLDDMGEVPRFGRIKNIKEYELKE